MHSVYRERVLQRESVEHSRAEHSRTEHSREEMAPDKSAAHDHGIFFDSPHRMRRVRMAKKASQVCDFVAEIVAKDRIDIETLTEEELRARSELELTKASLRMEATNRSRLQRKVDEMEADAHDCFEVQCELLRTIGHLEKTLDRVLLASKMVSRTPACRGLALRTLKTSVSQVTEGATSAKVLIDPRQKDLERALAESETKLAEQTTENVNKASTIRAMQESHQLLDEENRTNKNMVAVLEAQVQSLQDVIM
eukprot:3003494-Rhodomonas_salina.2